MKSASSQKIFIGILAAIILILAFLFNSVTNSKQTIEDEVVSLQDSVKRLNNTLAFSALRVEVLKEMNDNLTSQLYSKSYSHVKQEIKNIPVEARIIQQLIMDMEQGWVKMMDTKDPDALLRFFLPQFTTNSVKIDTKNMPFVQRHNDTDFRTHLNQLVATKDLSFSFDKPVFYGTLVRGDIFTTSYLSHLSASYEGKVVHKSTILCFVSGQKKSGKWLIGNYNWTRYDDYDISKDLRELML